MRAADEGGDVVLAMGVEFDIAQHDEVVIAADILEGARQGLGGVFVIAAEKLAKGLGHAARRIQQAFAVGIIAGPGQQHAHGGLGLFLRRTLNLGIRGFALEFLDDSVHFVSLVLGTKLTLLKFLVFPYHGG